MAHLSPARSVVGSVPFSQPGTAATGASGAWTAPTTGTVTKLAVSVVTAPVGSGLIVQFKHNGTTFATITVPDGTTATITSTPAEAFAATDTFTVNATSVGSTTGATGVVAQLDYQLA